MTLGEDAPTVVVDGVVEEAQATEVAGEEHHTSTPRRSKCKLGLQAPGIACSKVHLYFMCDIHY
jgi:hypothetical protein